MADHTMNANVHYTMLRRPDGRVVLARRSVGRGGDVGEHSMETTSCTTYNGSAKRCEPAAIRMKIDNALTNTRIHSFIMGILCCTAILQIVVSADRWQCCIRHPRYVLSCQRIRSTPRPVTHPTTGTILFYVHRKRGTGISCVRRGNGYRGMGLMRRSECIDLLTPESVCAVVR